MNAARVRIGRVRMKNGGADVRVLHTNPTGPIVDAVRALANRVSAYAEAPSAFVGIVFWRNEREPWRASYTIGWGTIDPDLPLPRLTRTAASQIEEYGTEERAVDRAMRNLGYVRDDDPEDAA